MLPINSAACKYCKTQICTSPFFFKKKMLVLHTDWLKRIKTDPKQNLLVDIKGNLFPIQTAE